MKATVKYMVRKFHAFGPSEIEVKEVEVNASNFLDAIDQAIALDKELLIDKNVIVTFKE